MPQDPPDPPPKPLRATVMPDAPRKAVTQARKTAPQNPLGQATALPRLSPTAMPGTTPERLTVSPDDLRRLAPKARPATLEAAAALLTRLIPAHLSDRDALFWAQDLQEAHAALVNDRLELLRAPDLREVPVHLARLKALLGRFDLTALCSKGLLSAAFRKASRVIDTAEEIAAARIEINELLTLLTAALEGLAALKSRLEAQAVALQALEAQVEAAVIAAAYLAEAAAPHLSRSFQDRRHSLGLTLLQIRTGQAQHPVEASLPARLVVAIQNIALVALPAWLESLAQFQARLKSSHAPSLTEARDLTYRLADLMPLFPQPE